MDTEYNLYVIASPLQLINAQEAVKKFSLNKNILVIIDTAGKNNTLQVNKVLKKSFFQDIIRIESSKKSRFFIYVKLIKQLQKKSYNKVFLGNFGSINHMIASNVNLKKLYLIDDGTITISIYEGLIKRFQTKFNMKKIRFYLFGLTTELKHTLNYFTVFRLPAKENVEILHNDYSYLKKEYSIKDFEKDKKIVYFLGQPLVENSLITKENYSKYMQEVIQYFKGNKIIYIPHRSEIFTDKIDSFVNENFVIQQSTIPVELLFLEDKVAPSIVSSFVSTALFTMEEIFHEKTEVISFKVEESDFLKDTEIYSTYYKYLEKTSVRMVQL